MMGAAGDSPVVEVVQRVGLPMPCVEKIPPPSDATSVIDAPTVCLRLLPSHLMRHPWMRSATSTFSTRCTKRSIHEQRGKSGMKIKEVRSDDGEY